MARALVKNASFPNPPNLLVNGAFDYWQRGTSGFSISTGVNYTADRMMCEAGGSPTAALSTDAPSGLHYSLLATRPSAGIWNMGQRLEAETSRLLANKTVTFSLWLKTSTGTGTVTLAVNTAASVDTWSASDINSGTQVSSLVVNFDTNWQRFSITVDLTGQSVQNGLMVRFQSTTNSAGVNIYTTGWMLTEGTAAPATFYRNQPNLEAEFAACQRFYETSAGLGTTPGASDYWSSVYQAAQTRQFVVFQTSKRTDQYVITTWNDIGSSSNSSALNYSSNTVGNFSDGAQGNRRLYGFHMATPSSHVNFPTRFGWAVNAEL